MVGFGPDLDGGTQRELVAMATVADTTSARARAPKSFFVFFTSKHLQLELQSVKVTVL